MKSKIEKINKVLEKNGVIGCIGTAQEFLDLQLDWRELEEEGCDDPLLLQNFSVFNYYFETDCDGEYAGANTIAKLLECIDLSEAAIREIKHILKKRPIARPMLPMRQ
jgi:hypothetical protein